MFVIYISAGVDPENLKGGALGKFFTIYHVNRPILRPLLRNVPKNLKLAAKGGPDPWTPQPSLAFSNYFYKPIISSVYISTMKDTVPVYIDLTNPD